MKPEWIRGTKTLECAVKGYLELRQKAGDDGVIEGETSLSGFFHRAYDVSRGLGERATRALTASGMIVSEQGQGRGVRVLRVADMTRKTVTVEELRALLVQTTTKEGVMMLNRNGVDHEEVTEVSASVALDPDTPVSSHDQPEERELIATATVPIAEMNGLLEQAKRWKKRAGDLEREIEAANATVAELRQENRELRGTVAARDESITVLRDTISAKNKQILARQEADEKMTRQVRETLELLSE